MPRARAHVSTQEMEKLIELVKSHRCLYDVRSSEHKDTQKVHNVWRSIAFIMGRDEINGLEWKKKWRNQRDIFVKKRREMRTKKSGLAMERAKRWHYLDMMSFLDQYAEESSADSQVTLHDSETEISEDNGNEDIMNTTAGSNASVTLKQEKIGSPVDPESSPLTTPKSTCSKKRKWKESSADDNGTELSLADLIQVHKLNREDIKEPAAASSAEELFFQSCTQRIKKLPLQIQSYLQLQISQLFFNAENPDIPPVQITPLPGLPTSLPISTTKPLTPQYDV